MGGLAVSWEHGQENNMIDTTHKRVPAPADSLHDELRALIASSRQRLAQFAVALPATEKVASLMRHLSWSHFVNLLPLKTGGAAANA